jgi:hypothetical protein
LSVKGLLRFAMMFFVIPFAILMLELSGAVKVVDLFAYYHAHGTDTIPTQLFSYAFNTCVGIVCYCVGDKLIVVWMMLWGRLKENLRRSNK